jgi:hypothetical protein
VTAALTVIAACADFVVSATLVAVTIALVFEVTVGAVNSPLLDTDPALAVHVTAWFAVLLTKTVNCRDWPDDTVALLGVIDTLTGPGGGGGGGGVPCDAVIATTALAVLVGSATLVATTLALVLALTLGAVYIPLLVMEPVVAAQFTAVLLVPET